MRINLVIACWSGFRRNERPHVLALVPFPDIGTAHLHKQLGTLSRLQHSITQITLVVSHDPRCPPEYTRYVLDSFPNTIGSTPVVKLFKPDNLGISYGAWAYAASLFRDAFDYYIFIEDDYCFVKDNFDHELVKMYDAVGCEYLMSYKKDDIYVTNGIIHARHLASRDWGWLMGEDSLPSIYHRGDMRCFVDAFEVETFPAPYTATPFFGIHKQIGLIMFGAGDFLLAPTQMISPITFDVTIPLGIKKYEK